MSSPAVAPPADRAAPPSPPARPARSLAARLFGLVGSYAVAITLLLLLLVLTFFGTLEQANTSLYDVQRRYFESVFVIHDVGPISLPLPGATLVLALLGLNLVVGGVIRMRKRGTTAGILVAHLGILLLLGGSVVEWMASQKGQMTLFEGQSADEFQSHYDWELVVRERKDGGDATEYVIPPPRLMRLDPEDVVRFVHAKLPFDVEVTGWLRNAQPQPTRASGADVIDGWTLKATKPEKEAEQNVPGAFVALRGKDGGTARARTLVWGATGVPWVVEQDRRRFEIELRKQRWTVPFTIALSRFVHVDYPGTGMPKEFSSYVTKRQDGVDRDIHITMNAPLRHQGYTFYQSGWGPQGAPPGTPLFSTFAVVRNPTDQLPKYACYVIAVGLLIHFITKLVLFLVRQTRTRAAARRSEA